MMPIINIHPHVSEAEAEAFRLTLKDADKFGLYCCHDGKSAMWSVIPNVALDLIFNARTGLPVTERTWVGLTDGEIEQLHTAWVLDGGFRQLCNAIETKLKERNT
jgi:hypothetical protein